ncbi:MAG: type I glyceraldehyde-3-phosphate dehydrogenase [Candidatus Parcubacteria bacterium]|nr:type I glyceraldehyde-3-phosphate dehydrogenase [Candidatus Parcubacteria bacterium]
MAIRVAINGFGRIGRLVLRAMAERGELGTFIKVVAVVDVATDAEYFAYQLKYDSVHGKFPGDVYSLRAKEEDTEHTILVVNDQKIKCIKAPKDLAELPWKEMEVDVVIEATGIFVDDVACQKHLDAGAKKVVITMPGKGNVPMFVVGVNHLKYDPKKDHIVSNASCTTNCLAPLIWALLKSGIGVEKGLLNTIHAYTATQKTVDGPSKKDWRGGRAAGINMIPSSTGAAKAVGKVIPEMAGRFNGLSVRVPVADVSMVDFTFLAGRDTSIEEIDAAMKEAAETYLADILGYTNENVVSTDLVHDPRSSIYDSLATVENALPGEKRFFKIIAWYDNEWGYSNRVIDLILSMAKKEAELALAA